MFLKKSSDVVSDIRAKTDDRALPAGLLYLSLEMQRFLLWTRNYTIRGIFSVRCGNRGNRTVKSDTKKVPSVLITKA